MLEFVCVDSTGVDFELRDGTMFGPMVKVVKVKHNGMVVSNMMEVALAVIDVLHNEENGLEYTSAKIVFDGVYDEWSFSV